MSDAPEPSDDAPFERPFEIVCPEDVRPGLWANFAQVSHSPYEFTLDFARLDFDEHGPTGGIVVSRVSVSPLLVSQLIEALQANWSTYAEHAMPPEARPPQAPPAG